MKKITLLIALCVSLTSYAQSIENGYQINVTVATNPVKAYLSYRDSAGNPVVDSVAVTDNTFIFTGVAENPFQATLQLSYNPDVFSLRRLRDSKQFFIEPGKIVLTSTDSVKNATITGSVIYDDSEKWTALAKDINDQLRANVAWFRGLSQEEQAENRSKAIEIERGLQEKMKDVAADFVRNSPDSWYALYRIYSDVVPREDADAGQAMLDLFSQRLKESKLGKERQARIDALKAVSVGAIAPLFTQNDPDGNPVNLSDFRGQWLLIDFWASWCGPCRAENPHVVEAYNQYKDKGFTILGVSLDQPDARDKWLKAIEDDHLTWAQVSDLQYWNNEAAKLYAVSAIPANFLLSPEGVIVAKNLRGKALTDELAKHLE